MSQVNRKFTLNKSLLVGDASKVVTISLEENTLMRQGNKKVIVEWKLLSTRKVSI